MRKTEKHPFMHPHAEKEGDRTVKNKCYLKRHIHAHIYPSGVEEKEKKRNDRKRRI